MVLTDDQKALQATARCFARERLLPEYQQREKIGTLDRALVREMGQLGLPGISLNAAIQINRCMEARGGAIVNIIADIGRGWPGLRKHGLPGPTT